MKLVRYIPNALSILRLLLSIPLAYALWNGRIPEALALLLAAGITDLADGFLARTWNARTALGAWLDPAADKTLITTVLVTLTIKQAVPLWFCGITMIRDAGLVIGTFSLLGSGFDVRIQPYLTGKMATVAQNVTLLAAMLLQIAPPAAKLLPALLVASAVLTLISSWQYGQAFGIILRRGRSLR